MEMYLMANGLKHLMYLIKDIWEKIIATVLPEEPEGRR